MTDVLRVAAVDLGAESGRVMTGSLHGDRIELQDTHRFANTPLRSPEGLHWNLSRLFAEIAGGLARAAQDGPLAGVGIDAWGCDYVLLDSEDRQLGQPFHYRDARTTGAVVDGVHRRVPRAELYRRTGIQTMPINTVFQLSAEAAAGRPELAGARRIALIPDLLGLRLTGTLVNEVTIASTTGLLEALGPRWALDLIDRLGLPHAPFTGTVVEPGVTLGPLLEGHSHLLGAAAGTPLRTVAGHDTASAFVAAPLRDRHSAILSSGTWSLLGLELDEPQLGPDAAAANLTNERGVDGTTRLLRNVMGLWLVQECRRCWEAEGHALDYGQLERLAHDARPDVALFDPDDESLLRGGDQVGGLDPQASHRDLMPARIAALCERSGQTAPAGPGELMRSILVSLACRYRMVLEQLIAVSGRRIDTIHVVGGGARNELLCRLTADLCERPVLAGPVEATALGNVLVQAAALGEVSGLAQMRELVRRSAPLVRHEPGAAQPAAETYQRFLAATGLRPASPDHADTSPSAHAA
jgi:rhamnulokinase